MNVSARQLHEPGFVDDVAAALADAGLPTGEPDPGDHRDRDGRRLRAARRRACTGSRRLGVRLAVDDFGTGYSSLCYLQRFPIDVLKIDRAFVASMGSPTAVSLAPGILALAASLGLCAVAEGAETLVQVDSLVESGLLAGPGLPLLPAGRTPRR